jgi:D-threo-aldose 1-dehydrogenase
MSMGYGTAALGRSLSRRDRIHLVEAAYDAGVRYFDTAPLYCTGAAEEALGRALRGRDDVTLATKVGIVPPGLIGVALRRPAAAGRFAPAQIRAQLEGSLRRLRREAVEVLLLHEVDSGAANAALDVLDDLRREGKIARAGIATNGAQSLAILAARVPDVVQLPAREAIDTAGATLVLHSALAGRVGATPARDLLQGVADAHPSAVVLVGSRREEHIREAAAALG